MAEKRASLPGHPGFNGEFCEPITGHYLLGNGYRAYNPSLMRFNSPDSLSPFAEGGVNAYGYCQGDPVNYRDPTGHIVGPGYIFRKVRAPLSVASASRTKALPATPSVDTLLDQSSKAADVSRYSGQKSGSISKRRRLAEHDEPRVIGSNTRGLPRIFNSELEPGQFRYKFYTSENLNKMRGVELRGHIAASKKGWDKTYGVWSGGANEFSSELMMLDRYIRKLIHKPAARLSAAKRGAISADLDTKMAGVRAAQ